MDDQAGQYARNLADFRRRAAEGVMTAAEATDYTEQAATAFLAACERNKSCLRDAVNLLCEAAVHPDPDIARAGSRGLFPLLVEKLSDSFAPEYCLLYDRVFAQVIEFCRRRTEAQALHEGLLRFGLEDESDLLARRSRLRARSASPLAARNVRKVIFISRVTLGADVAVTSVMMSAAQEVFPDAELVLYGSHKLNQLFGGDPRVRIREIGYERGGNLLSRLQVWLDLISATDEERQGHDEDEVLIIDPDSRLTQLGMLPLVSGDAGYFFFESRSYSQPGLPRLGQLAGHWINQLLPGSQPAFPTLSLPESERTRGEQIARRLRSGGAAHLVSLSLGVGGNARKRIAGAFEEQLLEGLLSDSILIIDKGGSAEERQQIDHLLAGLKARNRRVMETDSNNVGSLLAADRLETDILTWEGSIGAFAGLIGAGDEYVGYDSAGQHIAAALGVPTITVFGNSGSELFSERWHPYGREIIKAVRFEPDRSATAAQTQQVLADVLTIHRQLRKRIV